MIREIIINADDFGLKTSVNKAIIESFNNELINSTTIMANMPGFDEAVELAHENRITGKTGVHLTLSGGRPLTSEILKTDLFHDGSENDLKKYKRKLFFLSMDAKATTYKELAAQIEKVRKAGIPITHVDTHHHIDDIWSITRILLALLKTYGIPSMRILNNLNRSTIFYKSCYRRLINEFIKFNRANFSDLFGDQNEAISLLRNDIALCKNKKLEIMVHPDYYDDGILINRIRHQEVVFDYPEDIKAFIKPSMSRKI